VYCRVHLFFLVMTHEYAVRQIQRFDLQTGLHRDDVGLFDGQSIEPNGRRSNLHRVPIVQSRSPYEHKA